MVLNIVVAWSIDIIIIRLFINNKNVMLCCYVMTVVISSWEVWIPCDSCEFMMKSLVHFWKTETLFQNVIVNLQHRKHNLLIYYLQLVACGPHMAQIQLQWPSHE